MRFRRIVPLLTVTGVSLVAFAMLAAALTRGWVVVDLDRRVAEWVAADMPTWAEWSARPFSWLGGWIGITAASVAIVGSLVLARRAWVAVWVALGVSGIQLLTALTKAGYDRPRPEEGSAIPLPASSAFPSGHASGAVATAGIAAALAAEGWPRHRRVVWSAAAVVALGVGASRVVLGVHYVSDVLAGWALGAAWLALFLIVRDASRRHGAPDGRSDP